MRITAQLVRVADGFHVWSQDYDRELKGVFALQDDIAKRIGDALKLSLGVGTPVAARASIDPAAYDEYLKGRALLRSRNELPTAIEHFKAAVARAPSFAAAWSSLSLTCEASFWYEMTTPVEQVAMLSCEADAAERAAALEPNAAATEHALANVARSHFRYADAERHYLQAMQIDPSYPDIREDYAETLYEVGRLADAARAARQLVTLDPYYVVGWLRMRDVAIAFDRRTDVEEAVRQILAISPNIRFGKLAMIEYALAYGRADEARAALAQLQARSPQDATSLQILLPWALGDQSVDAGKLSAAIADVKPAMVNPYFVARGDVAGYNAYNETLGAVIQAYYFVNLYRNKQAGHAMLRDPRVKAKLAEYGFVAYWREKGWPAGCRPLGETDFECGTDVATVP